MPAVHDLVLALDRASSVALLGLAVLLVVRSRGRDPADEVGALAAAAVVTALALVDLSGLHGLLARGLGQLAGGELSRPMRRATKMAALVPILTSALAVVLLGCRGTLRTTMLLWLGGMALAGTVSELGGLAMRGAAARLGLLEEVAELGVTLAAGLRIAATALPVVRAGAPLMRPR